MKKVTFLILCCAAILTSFELAKLNPTFAESNQNSSDQPTNPNPPSAGKPPAFCQECDDSNKNIENINTSPAGGKGQVPSSCMDKSMDKSI
jgi:hypothetical protein